MSWCNHHSKHLSCRFTYNTEFKAWCMWEVWSFNVYGLGGEGWCVPVKRYDVIKPFAAHIWSTCVSTNDISFFQQYWDFKLYCERPSPIYIWSNNPTWDRYYHCEVIIMIFLWLFATKRKQTCHKFTFLEGLIIILQLQHQPNRLRPAAKFTMR